MFLTLTFEVADVKNDDGQGKARRNATEKALKSPKRITRLSRHKQILLKEVAIAFSESYDHVVQWGIVHFGELPFRYALAKDGDPIVDREGNQKYGVCDAHYLANWLAVRIPISGLSARLKNGVYNQSAETLLSQYRLRQVAQTNPRRLTGQKVGEVESRVYRDNTVNEEFQAAVKLAEDWQAPDQELAEAMQTIKKSSDPRLLPVLFARPDDFLLFCHTSSNRIFVCLPMLARNDPRANQSILQKGVERLTPLRPTEAPHVPNSPQWVLLPLRERDGASKRNARDLLTDPTVRPRTAELRFKNDHWCFNIVVEVPEPDTYVPTHFLGIHVGYYKVVWSLLRDNAVIQEGAIGLEHLQEVIQSAAIQRAYARENCRADRFPHYRGKLKLERERVVNQLIALATKHQAAIGIEDVSGVNKSTGAKKINLFRSHWDFGRFVDTLTYKAIMAGIPMPTGRGKKKSLFSVAAYAAYYTCSACGASNIGKERPIRHKDGTMVCQCGYEQDANRNSALVIAAKTREFWQKKQKTGAIKS